MGPVQEKETRAKVKAIKNIPIQVCPPERPSILLTKPEGRLISKAPKKEMAKRTSKKNMIRLKAALEASPFRAAGPKRAVITSPKVQYMTIMDSPYNKALVMAPKREEELLVKKLMVKGSKG
jgi:hypothetical protein